MLPQPGARGHPAQPLPAGLPRRRLHELPDRHGGRAAAALQGRLRKVAEKVLRRVPREQRPRHDHLALQGQARRPGHRDPQDARLLRAGCQLAPAPPADRRRGRRAAPTATLLERARRRLNTLYLHLNLTAISTLFQQYFILYNIRLCALIPTEAFLFPFQF